MMEREGGADVGGVDPPSCPSIALYIVDIGTGGHWFKAPFRRPAPKFKRKAGQGVAGGTIPVAIRVRLCDYPVMAEWQVSFRFFDNLYFFMRPQRVRKNPPFW
ncbi:hypothetical protein [Endothiovibrio diazotrophicus]